jgi:NAD(P)-dependent dehydrogenase (short-subunit alcohol dehydrogenase family)
MNSIEFFQESACIITGAANGNGLALSNFFLDKGCKIFTIDIKPLRKKINSSHFLGDVTNDKFINYVFKKIFKEKYKSLFLINNAGVSYSNKFNNLKWEKTIKTNLTAVYKWSLKYSEIIKKKKLHNSSIVNIGSLATIMGFPNNPSYQASKSGVLGLTRSLAFDFAPLGIRVNCVSPGYIKTNMTKLSYMNKLKNRQRIKHMLIKRWGEPEDVAGAVFFLCSRMASYITGINLFVDGGWSINGLSDG